MKPRANPTDRAVEAIKAVGGIIRTVEAITRGIYPRTLKQLVAEGELEQMSRGVYRLTTSTPLSNPDLVIVVSRVPEGVVCLVSALAFHNITTQIPRAVSVALKRNARAPRIAYPPTEFYHFSGKAFTEGIDMHYIDNIEVKIYNIEKTLADCFKFRNKIGIDIVLEALKFYRSRKRFNAEALLKYAKICRVEKAMKPYLEAIV